MRRMEAKPPIESELRVEVIPLSEAAANSHISGIKESVLCGLSGQSSARQDGGGVGQTFCKFDMLKKS